MSKIIEPLIRFKGFTDAWEQRKLGDESIEILAGGDIDKNKVTDNGKYPIYANALTNDGIVGYYNDYYRVKAPAVTVTGRGDVGHAQARVLDFTPVVRLLAVRSNHDCYFLENAINNHSVIVESTGVPQLTVPQLSSYDILFPKSIKEESKIGDFFHKFDNLITLHHRKYEKLKNLKQSMLEKMFPKNGEKFPEIRFKGFTDAWEQRKLKDIASFIRGSFPQPYTNPDFYDENGGKPFVQVADIGMGLELNQDTKTHISRIAESKSRFVEAGTVIVALQGSIETSIGRTAITQYDAFVDRTILIFESYRIPIDKIFLAQSRKKLFQKEKEKAWGATISTITKEHLSDFILGIPSLDEQVKIGLFFKNIDNLITLHQRKLEKLKNIKKSMLGKMFV